MNRAEFQEALLGVMEQKSHWAWAAFGDGTVPKEQLYVHFEQEYATYVRDFPIFIGRAFVQCPVPLVRQELAENLYEEATGGLVAGRPHPELFLEYPRGLGLDLERFNNVRLLPRAQSYRDLLDDQTQNQGWAIATAVSTLFIEGTRFERGDLDENAPKRPVPPLEEHPLVKVYGLSVEHLALTKAHRQVEGEHRQAAWRAVLDHVPEAEREAVVAAMAQTLAGWKRYRDGVAEASGVFRQP